jgi:hypothetical protein
MERPFVFCLYRKYYRRGIMQKINDNAIKQNANGDWAWSRSGPPCTAYEKDLKKPEKNLPAT